MARAEWIMSAFIGAVIVAGFFGPWVISLVLSIIMLGVWGSRRKRNRGTH